MLCESRFEVISLSRWDYAPMTKNAKISVAKRSDYFLLMVHVPRGSVRRSVPSLGTRALEVHHLGGT